MTARALVGRCTIPRMRIDQELRRLLVKELCLIVEPYDQYLAASFLGLQQPDVSALRRSRAEGFSIGRLLRAIARRHYDVEVHLRRIQRPYLRHPASVAVIRYDRF